MDNAALDAAKRDCEYLCQVLKIERPSQHAKCPGCGDTCMRVTPDKDGNGVWLFECMKGCGAGSVIDALIFFEGKSRKEAINEVAKKYGDPDTDGKPKHYYKPKTESSPVVTEFKYGKIAEPPVLDQARADQFVIESHRYLLDNLDLVQEFKRGVSPETITRYQIGFMQNQTVQMKPWSKPWLIPAAWVLPITDLSGRIRAVKFHFEKPRPRIKEKQSDGSWVEKEFQGKSLWLPFGTEPAWDREKNIKPRDSYYCFWPHPDSFDDPLLAREFSTDIMWWIDRIPPGELKREWDQKFEAEVLEYALEISKAYNDLSGPETMIAMTRAYESMRIKIQRAVAKAEEKDQSAEAVGFPEEKAPPDWNEYIFISPGELKALAVISCGLRATSITGGEGWIPPPEILACFRGVKVCLLFDDDPSKVDAKGIVRSPGREWFQKMSRALARAGAKSVIGWTGGFSNEQSHGKSEPGEVIDMPL